MYQQCLAVIQAGGYWKPPTWWRLNLTWVGSTRTQEADLNLRGEL